MNKKLFNVLCTIVMLLVVNSMHAQILRISAFGQEGFVMGDIAKTGINSPSAGYVDYASTGGLEANYYLKNNLGFGLRWSGTNFMRDFETYESDLTEMLGISNDPYDISPSYVYWAFGSDFGISYLIDISGKLQLEPYFYLGFKGLLSPMSSVIYSRENTTFQYKSKSHLFFGFSYSPGVKFHWNAFKHAGFFASLEYDGKSYLSDDERSMIYSYNSLEITDTEKNYNIHSLNIGLGLSFRFGKGLE